MVDSTLAEEEEVPTRKRPRLCKKCGSTDIRPSKVRGMLDMFLSWFSYAPFRCRSCWGRFHAYGPEILREQEEFRRQGRLPR